MKKRKEKKDRHARVRLKNRHLPSAPRPLQRRWGEKIARAKQRPYRPVLVPSRKHEHICATAPPTVSFIRIARFLSAPSAHIYRIADALEGAAGPLSSIREFETTAKSLHILQPSFLSPTLLCTHRRLRAGQKLEDRIESRHNFCVVWWSALKPGVRVCPMLPTRIAGVHDTTLSLPCRCSVPSALLRPSCSTPLPSREQCYKARSTTCTPPPQPHSPKFLQPRQCRSYGYITTDHYHKCQNLDELREPLEACSCKEKRMGR